MYPRCGGKAKMSLLLNLNTLLLIVNWQLCVKICYFFQWIHELTNFWETPLQLFLMTLDAYLLVQQIYITGKSTPSANTLRPAGGSLQSNNCRSHFNLTIFFDWRNNDKISRRFDIFTTPCSSNIRTDTITASKYTFRCIDQA